MDCLESMHLLAIDIGTTAVKVRYSLARARRVSLNIHSMQPWPSLALLLVVVDARPASLAPPSPALAGQRCAHATASSSGALVAVVLRDECVRAARRQQPQGTVGSTLLPH